VTAERDEGVVAFADVGDLVAEAGQQLGTEDAVAAGPGGITPDR
jgi:hypothetical protein